MAEPALQRTGPLALHHAVAVGQVGPRTRFAYRGAAATLAPLGAAFGVTPSTEACRAAAEGDHEIGRAHV